MSDHDAMLLLENLRELARKIEQTFPNTTTDVQPFPSGAVMLDVRRTDRLFVLAYMPSSGWFGVDEVHHEDGFGDQYRFGSQVFEEAAMELHRLLRDDPDPG